jgi:hypothetical protein
MADTKIGTRKLIDYVGTRAFIGQPYTGATAELKDGLLRNGKQIDIVFWTDTEKGKKFLRVGDTVDVVVKCNVGKEGGGSKIERQFRTFEFIGWTEKRR